MAERYKRRPLFQRSWKVIPELAWALNDARGELFRVNIAFSASSVWSNRWPEKRPETGSGWPQSRVRAPGLSRTSVPLDVSRPMWHVSPIAIVPGSPGIESIEASEEMTLEINK